METANIDMLDATLKGLDDFGPDGDTRRRRIMVIDSAWNAADGSVVKCAKDLNMSFADTLGLLTNPAIKRLPPDDLRVSALANAREQTDKPYPFDIDPRGVMEAESEKRAMQDLKNDPTNAKAFASLVNVAQAEEIRAGNRTHKLNRKRSLDTER